MKHQRGIFARNKLNILKSKEPRLRDWNIMNCEAITATASAWNQKNLDYEIETGTRRGRTLYWTTWNQKNLDYEIETVSAPPLLKTRDPLEIKRTLITRLKLYLGRTSGNEILVLEIKRTSITRLKPEISQLNNLEKKPLEIKRTSITRLKLDAQRRTCIVAQCNLKSKEPRLRDWNRIDVLSSLRAFIAWNQKNLDYEIETVSRGGKGIIAPSTLKSKEPRLRDWNNLSEQRIRDSLMLPWNQKNLDYEIETVIVPVPPVAAGNLKSKEPRLRDWNYSTDDACEQSIRAWNQKNLDYEIETLKYASLIACLYSLEIKRTSITRLKQVYQHCRRHWNNHLKSKEPRLRDWNHIDYRLILPFRVVLKSKEPRLRDWNMQEFVKLPEGQQQLEIKRTSITRLKRYLRSRRRNDLWLLKSKEPRLRDWNID